MCFGFKHGGCWVRLPGMVMDANVLFVLLLCCGLLFENYIVDASIFWNLR